MRETLCLCLIAYLGGLIQGTTGFGIMLVALPLMVLFIDIKTAIPLIMMLAVVMNLILVRRLARHVEARKALPLLAAALPGVPVGVYVLHSVDRHWLELLVGAVVVGTAATRWLRGEPGAELKKRWALAAGFSAGFFGGSIGASGPPVIVYTTLQPWPRHETKATLVTFFTVGGVVIVGLQFFSGLITAAVVHDFAWCLLPLLAGVLTGVRIFDRIDEARYGLAVHVLLFALGAMMLAKGAGFLGA